MKYNILLLLTLILTFTRCNKTEYIFSSDSEFVNIGYHFTDSARTFLSERREKYGMEQLTAEVCTTFTDNICTKGHRIYLQQFIGLYESHFTNDIIISLKKEDVIGPMLIKFSMYRYPNHIDLGAYKVTSQGMTSTTNVYVYVNLNS